MSARGWVDKIKGLLQREDEESIAHPAVQVQPIASNPIQAPTPTPAPVQTANVQIPVQPVMNPTPQPTRPVVPRTRHVPQMHKVMPGSSKEQMDWSLRQLNWVGEQFMAFAKRSQLPMEASLKRDEALLKLGYAIVTLALRTKPTQAPTEALRGLRAALKTALMAALRKEYHKHVTEEAKLGASMVEHVDGELSAVDNDVNEAVPLTTNICAHFCRLLSPAFGDEAILREKAAPELERLLNHVKANLPVQDLLL